MPAGAACPGADRPVAACLVRPTIADCPRALTIATMDGNVTAGSRLGKPGMKTIHAVYENGVFRPVEPVELPEGCEVVVEPRGAAGQPQPMDPEFAHLDSQGGLARHSLC